MAPRKTFKTYTHTHILAPTRARKASTYVCKQARKWKTHDDETGRHQRSASCRAKPSAWCYKVYCKSYVSSATDAQRRDARRPCTSVRLDTLSFIAATVTQNKSYFAAIVQPRFPFHSQITDGGTAAERAREKEKPSPAGAEDPFRICTAEIVVNHPVIHSFFFHLFSVS